MFSLVEQIWGMGYALAFFVAFVSFNLTMVIRFAIEKKDYVTPFRSFKFGDNIFLPVFAGFAGIILQNYEHQGRWYETNWWHILVFAVSLGTIFFLEGYYPGGTPSRSFLIPSQGYHTIMFGVTALIIVQTAIALVFAEGEFVYKLLSYAGLAGYFSTFLWDMATRTTHEPS